jgi:hypothetical protein
MPEQHANAAPEGAPPVSGKPDFLRDAYWNADTATPDYEGLWRDTQALKQREEKAKAAYIEQEGPRIRQEVRAQLEAERRKGLPGSADAYIAALPSRLPDGRYILTEQPSPDFRPEPGAEYIQLRRDDPQLAWFLELAHERGLTPAQVNKTITEFVAKTVPSTRELLRAAKARQEALYASLGENGEARVAHLYGKLRHKLGDQEAAAFFHGIDTPELVTALERVIAIGEGPSFSRRFNGTASADDLATLRKLQASREYLHGDPQVHARVSDGYKRLYPGTVNAATRSRGSR